MKWSMIWFSSMFFLPVMAPAGFVQVINNVSITVTACKKNEVILNIGGTPYTSKALQSMGFVPVWVQITNFNKNTDIQIVNTTNNITQVNQRVAAEYCQCNPILNAGSISLVLSAVLYSILLNDFRRIYQHEIQKPVPSGEVALKPWHELNYSTRFRMFLKTDAFIVKNKAAAIFSGIAGFGSWWYFANYNKQVDIAFNTLMLQEFTTIEPGKTDVYLAILNKDKKLLLNIIGLKIGEIIGKVEVQL